MIEKIKLNLTKIILCIAFFIISCAHLFYFLQDSIPVTSDYLFHLSRVENIYRNLKDGIFLSTIDQSNMNGLGYLIDIYYPSLFYYLPALLRFLLPVNIALQISIVLYNFIFMITQSYTSYRVLKNKTFSVAFPAIYISSYYLFIDHVSAQAISGYISILILPLVIFGIYDLIENKKWKLLFISMTLIAYTHILSLVLYSAIIVVCLILNYKKIDKYVVLNLMKAGVLSVLVSSAFLLPFIYYIGKDHYMVSGNIRSFITIEKSFDILQIFLFVFIFVLAVIIYNLLISKTKINKFLALCIVLLAISIYIYSSLCNWNVLSFFYIFQFKKRMGLLINIFACLIIAYAIPKKHLISIGTTIVFGFLLLENILSSMFGSTYEGEKVVSIITKDSFFISKNAEFSEKYCAIVFGEYIPYGLTFNDINFTKYLEENNVIDIANIVVSQEFSDIEQFKIENEYILSGDSEEIILDKIYYPVYNVKQENNNKIKIESYNGLIKITGILNGDFVLSYKNTLVQVIALFISIVALIFVFFRRRKIWQDKK